MVMKRKPAAHVDIEDLAVKLDQMIDAGHAIGVQFHHVESAAKQLRHLSNLLDSYQSERMQHNKN